MNETKETRNIKESTEKSKTNIQPTEYNWRWQRMNHFDKAVIESLSEPAKRVFKSLDYRSKQRVLKKVRKNELAKKRN